jgi:hypothetical protein
VDAGLSGGVQRKRAKYKDRVLSVCEERERKRWTDLESEIVKLVELSCDIE